MLEQTIPDQIEVSSAETEQFAALILNLGGALARAIAQTILVHAGNSCSASKESDGD